MISGVYGVLHRPTGRWYVGRSTHIGSRWPMHRRVARSGSTTKFHEALRTYPLDEFMWIVLEPCDAATAINTEVRWITKLGAYSDGFNSTEGGELTPGDYEAVRAKLSASWKGRTNYSFLGRKHSTYSLRLITEAARKRGAEWRAKIAAKALGRKPSEETRLAMSLAHKRIVVTKQRDGKGRFVK